MAEEDSPTSIEVKYLRDILAEAEEDEGIRDISEDEWRVLTAVRIDKAHGDETYDPEKAAKHSPSFTAEELEGICEDLVEAGELEKKGEVYALPEGE